jgi:hypothetical protein
MMKKKSKIAWIIKIVLLSVVVSIVFTLASTEILGRAGYPVAFALLAVFIIIGIIFDIVGIAVTAATEAPFNSMASHRERGAAESLRLLRSVEKVTGFCNDVVGDVTGIVSGTTAALIAARLMDGFKSETLLFPLLISGAVTGLTIGGKAVGKIFALSKSTSIVHRVGILLSFIAPASTRRK